MRECLEWGVGAQERKAGHPCREGGSNRDGRLVTDGTDRLGNVLRTMKTKFLSVREGHYKIRKKEN